MKLQNFIKSNQKQTNKIKSNLGIETKQFVPIFIAIASFKNELKTIPTNKEHQELLCIQFFINEFELENLEYKISKELKKELEKLNKYF